MSASGPLVAVGVLEAGVAEARRGIDADVDRITARGLQLLTVPTVGAGVGARDRAGRSVGAGETPPGGTVCGLTAGVTEAAVRDLELDGGGSVWAAIKATEFRVAPA